MPTIEPPSPGQPQTSAGQDERNHLDDYQPGQWWLKELEGEYWRASDAHGVVCKASQAVDLLQELLGVEVEIEAPNPGHPQQGVQASTGQDERDGFTQEWACDLLGIPRNNLSIAEFSEHQKDRIALVLKGARAAQPTTAGSREQDISVEALPLVEWVVERWYAEVSNRPLVNVHRRSLDDAWRQVLRHLGADPDALLGPDHDALTTNAAKGGER